MTKDDFTWMHTRKCHASHALKVVMHLMGKELVCASGKWPHVTTDAVAHVRWCHRQPRTWHRDHNGTHQSQLHVNKSVITCTRQFQRRHKPLRSYYTDLDKTYRSQPHEITEDVWYCRTPQWARHTDQNGTCSQRHMWPNTTYHTESVASSYTLWHKDQVELISFVCLWTKMALPVHVILSIIACLKAMTHKSW